MDQEISILVEMSDTVREITPNITYMWNLKKKDTNELIYKIEILTDIENKFMLTKGEGREG